jgi:hypothetical protein
VGTLTASLLSQVDNLTKGEREMAKTRRQEWESEMAETRRHRLKELKRLGAGFPDGARVWVTGEESWGTVVGRDGVNVVVQIDSDGVEVQCSPRQLVPEAEVSCG